MLYHCLLTRGIDEQLTSVVGLLLLQWGVCVCAQVHRCGCECEARGRSPVLLSGARHLGSLEKECLIGQELAN